MTEGPVPGRVYRVQWVPGTDHLLGECFCRAQHVSDDPNVLLDWLYGHPHGHDVRKVGPVPAQTHLTGVPG